MCDVCTITVREKSIKLHFFARSLLSLLEFQLNCGQRAKEQLFENSHTGPWFLGGQTRVEISRKYPQKALK